MYLLCGAQERCISGPRLWKLTARPGPGRGCICARAVRGGLGRWDVRGEGWSCLAFTWQWYVQICESPGEMLGGEGAGSLKKMENL